MANKLKVDELRAKLAERGLSTTGLKAILVERLEEAIAQDEKKEEAKGKRKRNRDSSDGTDDSNKLIAIGEFREMNVKELREEASKRGLVTTGTKKELLERLCNDANNDSDAPLKSGTDGAQDDKNGFEEEKEEEKIVTATKKGAAVLDQWIPDHIKSQYHVLQRASVMNLSFTSYCVHVCGRNWDFPCLFFQIDLRFFVECCRVMMYMMPC